MTMTVDQHSLVGQDYDEFIVKVRKADSPRWERRLMLAAEDIPFLEIKKYQTHLTFQKIGEKRP
jgi:hypothetical protein